MNFLKKLFSGPTGEECLKRGSALLEAHSYYEARLAFEQGVGCCAGKAGEEDLVRLLEAKLAETGRAMAELNLREAEHSLHKGERDKAAEHCQLVKTLTDDRELREKADRLLAEAPAAVRVVPADLPPSSCSSCSQHAVPDEDESGPEPAADLSPHIQFELLVNQLPPGMDERYAALGEDFAYMFVAAGNDRHEEALKLLEKWFTGEDRDIYFCEKGRILHRLGRERESETCFREALRANDANPLAQLGLAMLLLEEGRLQEAAVQLDGMIADEVLTGQALMMRGEVYQYSGETEAAINHYGRMLETPLATSAASRLVPLLTECGREQEARHVFKKYLHSKCSH